MDPYAGQTPAKVTEAIRGFITYLRHLHAAVMARVMKNNMDLRNLLRDSTTVTIEAMFGVMREIYGNGDTGGIKTNERGYGYATARAS